MVRESKPLRRFSPAYSPTMPAPCAHGTEGNLDPYIVGYATRHNPFMYYRSIVGNAGRCTAHELAALRRPLS